MKVKNFVLIFFLFLSFVSEANEPVGVIRVQNPEMFLRKSSLFLSKSNPVSGGRFDLTISSKIITPELSPLNLKMPVTAYLYFSDDALHPVVFGTLLPGKSPKVIPFQPGQNLIPEIRNNRQVVYADRKFKPQVRGLQADTIKLPNKLIAAQYFFRDRVKLPGQTGSGSDLADLVSTEFNKISFTADFTTADLLNVDMELDAKKQSGLLDFSNKILPRFPALPFMLPNPEYYFYLALPAEQTATRWLIAFFASVEPDFANNEQVYGCFLHSVATGDHATAISVSKSKDFYLLSGILPTKEQKEHFEKFLKSHGDSYSGKAYIFHSSTGMNVYVQIVGNRANLLIRKQTMNDQDVTQTFRRLQPARVLLGKRTFLRAAIRKADGRYEQIMSGSMANGKFRFIGNLPPEAVLHTIPDLLTGEDLFHE